MSNILVTVVMGVYNQHNTAELEEAVQSILAQSMREWELIICDDGSEGEAARNLKNYENRDPRIRVIRHSENKGLAATLNTCIAHLTISRCLSVRNTEQGASFRKWLRAGSFLLCVSIILATMFLKQHSVFDVITAFILAGAMYGVLYRNDRITLQRQRRSSRRRVRA